MRSLVASSILYVPLQVTLTDTGVILFPSLTFCKKYIFDQNSGVLDQLRAGAVGAGQARAWLEQHTASRESVFRLLSHATLDTTNNFPCTTVEGPAAGSPCSFPYVYPDCEVGPHIYTIPPSTSSPCSSWLPSPPTVSAATTQ